ncbi:hypothetical protein APHAL10511_003968 [Amanita phalloides]|nr:hypothetical protein APHAL10511_003968 [Amanita phalloides]
MADLIRSAKSGSDWNSNDLAAYNIIVRRQSAVDFFGYQPDTIPETIDPDFLTAPVPPNGNLSDTTYRLLQYINLAATAHSGQESAIDDVARELLRLLGFEERGTLLRSRYAIPFMISGDTGRIAQTNICLFQGSSTILLVIQEDKSAISNKDPEAQVTAEGIAAFQYNNAARDRAGLDKLKSMVIPAITMVGTRPIFYKIHVTQALSDAVAMSQYPIMQTTVFKCVIAPRSRRLSEGMEVPEFRQDILKYCNAFRKMAKGHWESFIV